MGKIIIKGRGAIEGVASGTCNSISDSIAGNSGALGDVDGVVHERGNINYGYQSKMQYWSSRVLKGRMVFQLI